MPCSGSTTPSTSGTPGIPDAIAPAAPNGLRASVSDQGIVLTWNPNLELDLSGYDVYRSTTLGGTYTKQNTSRLTAPTFNDTTAASGSASFYHVTATDQSGNVSANASVSATRPNTIGSAPAAPTSPVASGTTSGVGLTWTASVSSGVAGYNVYYSAASGGPFTLITNTPVIGTSYADSTAPAGVLAYYNIKSVNTSGLLSSASATVHATPMDTTAPAVPSGLVATSGSSSVFLLWNANTESDLAGYNVYSATSADGVFSKLNGSTLVTATYTDSSITAGQTLYYAVTAIDTSNNESAMSTSVSATRPVGSASSLPIKYSGSDAPALVMASLWDTAPANGHLARECMYVWDAGDAGSDYNHVQVRSPLFAHLYKTAGSYTITCTRIDPDMTQTTYSGNVTVSASTRTKIYVDTAAGNDNNNGNSNAPLKTIKAAKAKTGNNFELALKRGQTFIMTPADGPINVGFSNIVLSDYGDTTLAIPVLFVQMPTTSGDVGSSAPVLTFSPNARNVRIVNVKFDSNAVPGSYTKSGKKTNGIAPQVGHVSGQGIVYCGCQVGNMEHGWYFDGTPNFWLVQRCVQIGANIPDHFCWGTGTYGVHLGNVQVNTIDENGTRFADSGLRYAWLHDGTYGKTTNYKAVLAIRHLHQAAITKCTATGANIGFSPLDDNDTVDDIVFDSTLVTGGAFVNLSPRCTNIDWHNLIVDTGKNRIPCFVMGIAVTQTLADQLIQNIRFFHPSFITSAPNSVGISMQQGSIVTAAGAFVQNNVPTGIVIENVLMTNPKLLPSNNGAGIFSKQGLDGVLTGIAKIAGNTWPIVGYDASSHPASVTSDKTHAIGGQITNANFAKLPHVSGEQYVQVAVDSNYLPITNPTLSALEPLSRWDFDGNLRPVVGGKVYCGAKTPAGVNAVTIYVDPNGNDSNTGSFAKPIRTLTKLSQMATAGTVAQINNGTYTNQALVLNGGTVSNPITVQAQSVGGVIVDGNGVVPTLLSGGDYVNLSGVTFKNANSAAAHPAVTTSNGTGWNLTDVTVTACNQVGIYVGASNSTLTRCIASANGKSGITGSSCSNVVLQDCQQINNNGSSANDPSTGLAGGGDWLNCSNITFNNLISTGNKGPGLWLDENTSNITITGGTFASQAWGADANLAPGIVVAATAGPISISGATFTSNAGGAVRLFECQNVTINGLTLNASQYILLRDLSTSALPLKNITSTNNIFKDAYYTTDVAGGQRPFTVTSGIDKDITLNSDSFTFSSGSTLIYWVAGAGRPLTSIAAVRSQLRFELQGTSNR